MEEEKEAQTTAADRWRPTRLSRLFPKKATEQAG